MTILELKKIYSKQVKSFDFDLILAHCLKKSREFILTNPALNLKSSIINKTELALKKRINNYPVAYLTGHKEFYGLDFLVNKDVLIPRPETEIMVEEALKRITNYELPITNYVIDIGTGSGCIIITLAIELTRYGRVSQQRTLPVVKTGSDNKPAESPNGRLCRNVKLFAVDISTKALKTAKKNAKFHDVNKQIKFLQGNLLEPFIKSKIKNDQTKLIITANLPYLTPTQVKNSPTIKNEPKLALISGVDGLKHYRELFKQIKKYKISNYTILCEIDHTQTTNIKKLINHELPHVKFKIKKDLSGYNRLVIINSDNL